MAELPILSSSQDVEDFKSTETVETKGELLNILNIFLEQNKTLFSNPSLHADYGVKWNANTQIPYGHLSEKSYEEIKKMYPTRHLFVWFMIYCKKLVQTRELTLRDRAYLWSKFETEHELSNSLEESLILSPLKDMEDSKSTESSL